MSAWGSLARKLGTDRFTWDIVGMGDSSDDDQMGGPADPAATAVAVGDVLAPSAPAATAVDNGLLALLESSDDEMGRNKQAGILLQKSRHVFMFQNIHKHRTSNRWQRRNTKPYNEQTNKKQKKKRHRKRAHIEVVPCSVCNNFWQRCVRI